MHTCLDLTFSSQDCSCSPPSHLLHQRITPTLTSESPAWPEGWEPQSPVLVQNAPDAAVPSPMRWVYSWQQSPPHHLLRGGEGGQGRRGVEGETGATEEARREQPVC